MSKTYVQATAGKYDHNVSSSTTALDSFGSATTSGNSIYVVFYGQYVGGYACSGVSDTAGNTYELVVQSGLDEVASRGRTLIYAAHDITGHAANAVTITHAASTAHSVHAIAVEVSADDVQSTDRTGADTDAYNDQSLTVSGSAENTDAGAFVLAGCGVYNGANNPSPTLPSGFTSLYLYAPASSSYRPAARFAYKIAGGAETSSAQFDVAVSDLAMTGVIASFKEAAAAPSAEWAPLVRATNTLLRM